MGAEERHKLSCDMRKLLGKYRISGGMASVNECKMEIEQRNREMKENHIRTKPKLVASAATGGFRITKTNKRKK